MAEEKVFGYARVSSKDQNETRQVEALKEAGVEERNIFIDRVSGKSFDRPMYQAMIMSMREGDTLIITSVDRLGRNYTAIMEEWRHITQEIKANIKVLEIPLLDTTLTGDLDGRFIANLVLQLLSYISEKERASIRERQRQGLEIAKANGKQLGRPALESPPEFLSVYKEWKRGEITAVAAMKKLNVKKTSFYKFVKIHEGS